MNSRRNFLKFSGLAGLGLAGGGIMKGFATELPDKDLVSQSLNPEQFTPSSPIRDLRHSVVHYDIATYCGHPREVGFHYFGGGEILVGHKHAPSYYKVYTDVRHVAYMSRSLCMFQRSMDGGKTWPKENEQIILDNVAFLKNPEELLSRKNERLKNYDMFRPESIFFSHNFPAYTTAYAPDSPMFKGGSPSKCFFFRSPDKGKTWEKIPILVKNPHGEELSITRMNTPVIRMPDGKTLLTSFHLQTGINTDDEKELLRSFMCIFSSTDQGASWQFLSRPIVDPTGESGFGYQTLLLLPSGELQCYVLNGYRKSETVEGMHNAICMVSSNDGGKTWSEGIPISGKGLDIWKNPGKTGVIYRSPWPILLKDGRIIVVFARRRMPTGIGGIISSDGGKTWSPDFIIRDDGQRWNEDNHEEGEWGDLGYPVGCQLDDGQIFIAYYFNNKDIGRNPQGGTRYISASMFRI